MIQKKYVTLQFSIINFRHVMMKIRISITLFLAILIISGCALDVSHEKEIRHFRQKRINYLKSRQGYLNLVGLYWFYDGQYQLGSGKDQLWQVSDDPKQWGTKVDRCTFCEKWNRSNRYGRATIPSDFRSSCKCAVQIHREAVLRSTIPGWRIYTMMLMKYLKKLIKH